ncbi:MAG: SRPBCC domain-containing protein, partial [Steroidobacteraceae bacterium]
MSIAPVLHSVEVKAPPARAFELFTAHIGKWWPKGKTVAPNPHAEIVMEPRPGGRWYERDAEGNETPWGRVLAWEPPGRVLLGWQLNAQWRYDPDFLTELELSFAAQAA